MWPNLLTSQVVGVYFIAVVLVIPILILIFVYGRIAWILARKLDNDILTDAQEKRQTQQEDKMVNKVTDVRQKNYELAKRNTIKTLLIVGVCFVICWTGNQIWVLLFNLGWEINWDSPAYQFFVLMICVNCTINPFVYLAQYKEYQNALKTLICGKKKSRLLNEVQSNCTSTVSLDCSS